MGLLRLAMEIMEMCGDDDGLTISALKEMGKLARKPNLASFLQTVSIVNVIKGLVDLADLTSTF